MDAVVRYRVVGERSSEVAAWLRCNDVDPADVPFKSDVFVESDEAGVWVIRYVVYVRSLDGVIRYDPVTLKYVYGHRVVPLQNDPPMWWLCEEVASPGGGASSCVP